MPDGSERHQHPDADINTELQNFVLNNKNLENYVFGFANKKHLFTWFSPVDLGYMYANEFEIWIYDVPEFLVVKGSRQLCFRTSDAIWSKKLSLHELRKMKNT